MGQFRPHIENKELSSLFSFLDTMAHDWGIGVHCFSDVDDPILREYHKNSGGSAGDEITLGEFDCEYCLVLAYAHELGHCRTKFSVDRVDCECQAWLSAISLIKSHSTHVHFPPSAIAWACECLISYESYYRGAGGEAIAYRDRSIPATILMSIQNINH